MVVPRSWKEADAVAALHDFLRKPPPRRAAIRELLTELLSPDPFARRCAADLARRVSAREPCILRKYADVFIELVIELPAAAWQARGYVTLAAVLNASNHSQRMKLVSLVRSLANDERNAIRAIALEALAILAVAEPELRDEAIFLLEHSRREGTPAMRMRARRMLLLLLASENKVRRK